LWKDCADYLLDEEEKAEDLMEEGARLSFAALQWLPQSSHEVSTGM
jgi:hypothetical protein